MVTKTGARKATKCDAYVELLTSHIEGFKCELKSGHDGPHYMGAGHLWSHDYTDRIEKATAIVWVPKGPAFLVQAPVDQLPGRPALAERKRVLDEIKRMGAQAPTWRS